MKRIITIFCLYVLTVVVWANPVDMQIARQTAAGVLGKNVVPADESLARYTLSSAEMPAYYLFSAEDGIGFAIISGDDAFPKVIGYSLEGGFTDEQAMPQALVTYLKAFEQYVTLCNEGMAFAPESMKGLFAARINAGASPLLKSQWGQHAPYNTFCPQKDGVACPSGCVATALAQILYYWKWPEQGTGMGIATGPNGAVLTSSLEHTYQWDAMMSTTAENCQSEASAAAVAQLLYDCGLSVNMTYGTNGSTAGTPVAAFYRNFGYIPSKLRTKMREVFESDAEYLSAIADEIDQGRPVYQAASSSTGSGGDAAGHAYVIDGYDTNGLVHVNWGWDGNFDGYYDLTLMNPSSYSFTLNQRILIGIEPAKNGETGEPVDYPYMGTAPKCDRAVGTTIRKSVNFSITAGNIWNLAGTSHTWSMTFGLFNPEGKMLETVNAGRMYETVSLNSSSYYRDDAFVVSCKIKGSYNGDYAIRTIFREGSGEWILPDMKGGLANNAIYVKLSGTNVTFTDGTDFKTQVTAGIHEKENYNLSDSFFYDLNGREVKTPRKGFYIQNGRKVVY